MRQSTEVLAAFICHQNRCREDEKRQRARETGRKEQKYSFYGAIISTERDIFIHSQRRCF